MKQKLLLFTLMLVSCIVSLYADDYVPDMTKALIINDWGAISQGQNVTVKDATGKFVVDIAGESAKIKTEAGKRDMYLNPLNVMECPMANGYRLVTGGKTGSMTLTLPAETGGLYIYTHVGSSGLGRRMYVMKKSEEISILPPNTKIEGVDADGNNKGGYEYQKVYINKADIDTKNNNVTMTITWDASIYICGFCFVPGEKIPDDYFKVKPYAVYDNGTLTFCYDNKWGNSDDTIYPISNYSSRSWDDIAGSTTSVVFAPSFAQCTEITSTYAWFGGFTSLKSITGLENLNTQNVTTMYNMFYNCSSLTSLDVSNFNTKNVTNMSGMFAGCSGLTSLDVGHFNTENVTNMSGMFANCSYLTSIDITNFDPRNVTTMSDMFYGCSSLTALNIVFPSWAGKLLSTSGMFAYCSSLTSLSVKVDTEKVTNMSGMFYGCSGLTSIDVSQFNTENVTNMTSMFYGCTGLSVLDLRNFSIKKLTDATDFYAACSEDLVVYLPEGWNADKVTRTASLVPIGDYLYNIYNDKHAVLAYLNRPVTIAGDVVVPSKVTYQGEECKVTKVGRMSFAESTSEKNLYTYLTDEEYALVSSITFEEGIEEIDCADIAYFSHCNIINIPKSVKYISPKTYQLYGSSRSYTDFYGHNSNNITFNVDTENSVYCSVDGVLYDKDMKTLLRCPRNKADVFTVPETVETIGDLAFANCEQLTFVELPKGLKSIGTPEEPTSYFDGVFQRCYGLHEINIPAGVKYIGTKAFYNCTYLEKITSYIKNPEGYDDANRYSSRVYDNAALYVPFGTKEKYLAADGWKNFANIVEMPEDNIVNNVIVGDYIYTLYNEDHHAEMQGIVNNLSGDVVIPATLEYDGVTYNIKKVNSLTNMYYLDEATNTYKYINYSPYGYDDGVPVPDYTKVTSITLENGIESVSDYYLCTYWYCKFINFPKSVTYISPETYYMRFMLGSGYSDDSRLENKHHYTLVFNDITYNVDAENSVYASRDGVLYDKEMKTLLRCPKGWEGKFVVPDGVEKIDRFGFFFCPLITEIQLPTSMKVLGDDGGEWATGARLFGACYSLEKINIPEGVERIESMSFRTCYSLKELTMPSSLKYYNTRALATNESLETFNWQDCELETLDISDGYPLFGSDCPNCTISLPKSVKNIICTTTRDDYSSLYNALFSGGIVPDELTLPASIKKFEASQLFSFSSSSKALAPLKKLYVLMDFMPDIDEYFFGKDIVNKRVGKKVVMEELFPQTWADQCTLYVPENLVEAYKAHAVWGKFPNIVGVEVTREIDPIEEVTTIAFEGSDFVSANETPVDLNNTVVNDTYFSINNNSNTDGYYDATEQCIVINKATSGEAMQTVVASALGSADFISNYTGMVIEVNGKGSITISAQTLGNNRLAVKIGSADAKTYTQTEKGNVTVNYDVTENAYVYIYAVDADNQQQSLSMDVTASENAVKVYSITVTPSVTAIESVASNSSDAVFGKIYSIDGKQLSAPQKGLNILRMSDGTTRKIVR